LNIKAEKADYEKVISKINKAQSENEAKVIRREDQEAFKMQGTFSESLTNPAI